MGVPLWNKLKLKKATNLNKQTNSKQSHETKYYKITETLYALSLVDRCVYMRVCKHGYDVSDLRVFLRIIFLQQ